MLFARYAAKLAICCPFALLCYLPLSGFLRLRVKTLCPLVGAAVTAFVLLGALVSWRVLAKNKLTGPIWGAVGLLLLLGVAALFVWWTYAPPVLPLFIDPTNGTVGLPAIGM